MGDDSLATYDQQAVGEYLTNHGSRSIIYTLLISQPLTREEIENSPARASMRAVAYRAAGRGERARENVSLRTLLRKGVDCGILYAFRSGGRNYYFLNSDLMVSPRPITDRCSEGEEAVLDVTAEDRVGEIIGNVALTPRSRAASSNVMPIPHVESEKRLLMWISWLTTPVKRDILRAIAENGDISRPSLRKRLGFWADRLVVNEGVPAGILGMEGKDITFQFSSLSTDCQSVDGEGPGGCFRWIERPPSFMLSRSYEPLICVHGSRATLEELKRQKVSPMSALQELESAGRKIIPKNRRRCLTTNFLEFASLVGTFDAFQFNSERAPTLPLLIPDRISANSGEEPIVWVKETSEPVSISKTQFAEEASRIISSRKNEVERIAEVEQLMRRIARERIQEHLEMVERKMSALQSRVSGTGFSLGRNSLTAFAQLEGERDDLLNEKKYAEKFFDMIFGSEESKA